MIDKEKVVKGLRCIKGDYIPCATCKYADADGYGRGDRCKRQCASDALALLKEQPNIVRCKDCSNWIPGYITDHDDFIPPKCGKYQQMVGHSADDYCSLAERE